MFNNKPAEMTNALIDQATHAAEQVAKTGQQLASSALEGVRHTSHQVRVKAEHASDNTVHYIQHEPVKAMLMAAATGAALMALINLISRSRSQH
ncbi:hypothetical protein [Rhodoferax sp.]|jgi:ElaB/YqjD/DUF883 family membrane-anchored ribosome-binding protein|uniref:hypothetical protein n=1 Tax=Rhodoferax sp. TaxID=50421 RepID=UPI002718E383|nr:hypothetical protein [Rhodoferax sp.]MDO9142794.1 hypothetical protein [Rhodoferax sp.]MDP1529726.1 hypothetical protein [Rhodoferax sp.]MDP1945802.1 hypothetical protein [Rhodoferax sp.]MDP2441379.1 hypothetical protein [Rhodoferax sp.]MDP3191703.1 hypothetical protein [Rhodoferax sp.]